MNTWLPPFVYTFLKDADQLRESFSIGLAYLYWIFSIAVPSDKLPMALPPDWLHQTEIMVSILPICDNPREDSLRSTRMFEAGD